MYQYTNFKLLQNKSLKEKTCCRVCCIWTWGDSNYAWYHHCPLVLTKQISTQTNSCFLLFTRLLHDREGAENYGEGDKTLE